MKYKHLSLNNRLDIEKYLADGFNFTEISRLLNKSNRCISKEIFKRRVRIKKKNPFSNSKDFVCPKLIRPPYVCNGCDRKLLVVILDMNIILKMLILLIETL